MGKLDNKIALITGGSVRLCHGTEEAAVDALGERAMGIQADAGKLDTWTGCMR
jgi:hypothetical protein